MGVIVETFWIIVEGLLLIVVIGLPVVGEWLITMERRQKIVDRRMLVVEWMLIV